ncbi:MAG: pro-sigmaK processing inhibitor BofA [Clostridiales bacterium]|uniref:pro-sigmaK processing inhibitor BofA family protein n=1 Tax=Clostridium sp. N3C TaxID=1776758 RepID=UPI00092DF142|nr:pro-sigmaK processing inhibitor BofA family protein [Clostridium sp. N3C]NLZ49694.1 pro-sigmaK processing inhibitor BofA [Clostridiales bacterium]SCN25981.1 Bypass-of-forespore protein A [Clostridium sp. N3C]
MDPLFTFLIVVFVLFLIVKTFSRTFRFIKFIVLNCVLGLILLLCANFIGTFYGFTLGINVLTILVAGFCGIPGLIFLIVFKLFI